MDASSRGEGKGKGKGKVEVGSGVVVAWAQSQRTRTSPAHVARLPYSIEAQSPVSPWQRKSRALGLVTDICSVSIASSLPESIGSIHAKVGAGDESQRSPVRGPAFTSRDAACLYRIAIKCVPPSRHPLEATKLRIGYMLPSKAIELVDAELRRNKRQIHLLQGERHTSLQATKDQIEAVVARAQQHAKEIEDMAVSRVVEKSKKYRKAVMATRTRALQAITHHKTIRMKNTVFVAWARTWAREKQ